MSLRRFNSTRRRPLCAAFFMIPALLWMSFVAPLSADSSPAFSILPSDGSVQSLRGVKVPLGGEAGSASAYLLCREATMARRQWGALRIGVLPQAVLSGVELQLLPGALGGVWATDLSEFLLEQKSLHDAVIEDFVVVNASGQRILKAATAILDPRHGKIELRKVLFHMQFSLPGEHRQATLWLAGASAGAVQLTGDDSQLIRIAP